MYKKLKVAVGIFLSVNLLINPIASAALPPEYFLNDIRFFNKNVSCLPGSSASGVSGGSNQEKIWGWLKGVGLTDEQAAGIIGNIQAESGFSPTRHETGAAWGKGGWGLAQWTFGRRTQISSALPDELKKYYAAEYGGPADENGRIASIPEADNDKLLIFEMEFLMQESQARRSRDNSSISEWDGLKATTTLEDALVYWHDNFERSADSRQRVIENRGKFAKTVYDQFSGQGSSGGSGDSCGSSSGSNSDFTKKVLDYAWPKNEKGKKDQMPAYAEAVSKTRAAGGFFGNTGCNGNDCGGFVTILMHDSGWDPNYNSGKQGTSGVRANYLKNPSNGWELLGTGNTINVADLKPGDVNIKDGHTFVFVGEIDGFQTNIASASECVHAPMAGLESLTDASTEWYRKK